MKRISIILAVLALAGCGSGPPSRFYTLDSVPSRTQTYSAKMAPFTVDAVHIPPALDRLAMVRGEAGHQIEISDQNRWGAPFADMALQTLAQDLEERLPAGTVLPPNSPAPAHARGLVVNIQHFQPDASGTVTLDAEWSLTSGSSAAPILQNSVHLTEGGGGSANGQAAAMSRLLGRLADKIARVIANPAS